MSDIIQNYPQGYISAGVSNAPNVQQYVTLQDKIAEKKRSLINDGYTEISANVYEKKVGNKTISVRINDANGEVSTEETTEISPSKTVNEETAQLQYFTREIRKTEDAIKRATNDNTRNYLVSRLQDLQQMRSDLIKTGNAYTSKLIGPQTKTETQPTYFIIPGEGNKLSSPLGISPALYQKIQRDNEQAIREEGLKRIEQGLPLFKTNSDLSKSDNIIKVQTSSTPLISQIPQESSRLEGFRTRVEGLQAREEAFYNNEGFQRIRAVADLSTPIVGQTGSNVLYGFMAGPIQIGGAGINVFEKVYATAEALTIPETRKNVLPELSRAGKETLTQLKEPETLITVGALGLIGGSARAIEVRNQAIYSDFKNVKTTSTDILRTKEVVRTPEARYIETNTQKGSDFVISELVKQKNVEVSNPIKQITMKLELSDVGRTGQRTVLINPETGKTQIIERIQAEGPLFRDSMDVIKIIEQVGDKQFKFSVYDTAKFLEKTNPKPIAEFIYTQEQRPISLGTTKQVGEITIEPSKPGERFARTSQQNIITRDTLVGDYLQTTKVTENIIQKIKLDKPFIVDSEKQVGIILNKKGQTLGVVSKDVTQKAIPVFGKETFEPNIIKTEGYKVLEKKFPQRVSETLNLKEVEISLKKLNPKKAEAIRKEQAKDVFGTKSSLSELNAKQLNILAEKKGLNIKEFFKEYTELNKKISIAEKELTTEQKNALLEKTLKDYREGKITSQEIDSIRSAIGIFGKEQKSIALYDFKQQRYKLLEQFKKDIPKANIGGMSTKQILEEPLLQTETIISKLERVKEIRFRSKLGESSTTNVKPYTTNIPDIKVNTLNKPITSLGISPKSEVSNRVINNSRIRQTPVDITRSRVFQTPLKENVQDIFTQQIPQLKQQPNSKSKTESTIKQEQKIEQLQTPQQRQSEKPKTQNKQTEIDITRYTNQTQIVPPLFSKTGKDSSRYKLEVRKKGKFIPVNVSSDIEELTSQGVDILKNTARASFKIRSEKGDTINIPTPTSFTRSKRDSNVIVQPRELRISSFGEKQELRLSKTRRNFKI